MTYQSDVLRTECEYNENTLRRLVEERTMRLDHAADGLCTEAGEFKDAMKKHKWYGTPLDYENLREELGDLLYYIALACDALNATIEDVQAANVRKLKARYPDGFTAEDATDRDTDAEMEAMRILKTDLGVYEWAVSNLNSYDWIPLQQRVGGGEWEKYAFVIKYMWEKCGWNWGDNGWTWGDNGASHLPVTDREWDNAVRVIRLALGGNWDEAEYVLQAWYGGSNYGLAEGNKILNEAVAKLREMESRQCK